ncbi:S8 family serine peptidase [Trichothermofontia sichuanensis B231]|uniref:S8 family peptidase n=1 Tax=Trichothermofontia sichuanensis TaxID=3045816 RepID=UPI002247D677|nr:S8 family serine peptidase [Trichothermofontia sichuanensis]UZQ54336.1 S8 family serine peptidase [Trichothermofontia sichuanensis B231]
MRVLIQMRYQPQLATAAQMATGLTTAALPSSFLPGLAPDLRFPPVPIPDRQPRTQVGITEVGRLYRFNAEPEASTYLVRGEVPDQAALDRLMAAADRNDNIVGVFADPRISHFRICPGDPPLGNHLGVATALGVEQLRARGLNGSNVLVAIVDTGINLNYLRNRGLNPKFDASKSWAPVPNLPLGNMPVDHGTMCAFDVCIAAPNCTLLDYALLTSRAGGSTVMEGFLSDAVKAYSQLLQLLMSAGANKPALVVNNSWGMFHPSWDFPTNHPGNYSDNPNHPFNIVVESLADAGADILFAAGNCGVECPDSRCQGVTNRTLYGANSHPSVLTIAGVSLDKVRVGYSSQGPGRLATEKPDLCGYTHFAGSGVYAADGGTSAACPVVAGVVAALRTAYPPGQLSPAQLRQLLRRTADDLGSLGFDYAHGFGLVNPIAFLKSQEQRDVRELKPGEQLTGNLSKVGESALFQLKVNPTLTIDLKGPAGADFDLFVRKGAKPTIREFDYRGYTRAADEQIKIEAIEPGDYYIMVRAYRGTGPFTLKATFS